MGEHRKRHLVSLDPSTSKMTKHQIPGGDSNDPWGLAPDDDVVGYTGAPVEQGSRCWFPKFHRGLRQVGSGVAVSEPFATVALPECSSVVSGARARDAKIVEATTTRKDDGTYVEAMISSNSNDSMQPLGITPNRGKAQGTFFYTVGLAAGVDPTSGPALAKRIGFARLPIKEQIKHARDDDDADDGRRSQYAPRLGTIRSLATTTPMAVPDQYDLSTSTDNMTVADPRSSPNRPEHGLFADRLVDDSRTSGSGHR